MQLLEKLNDRQAEAVKSYSGPLLVLAGAGSGKTRVLTYRIAYLIEHAGVSPHHILAITFTNKAASEMKERVDALLGAVSEKMWVSTFHSSCVKILRREITHLNYDSNFVIYDSSDQQTLVKQCLKELNIDDKKYPPRAVISAISQVKNKLWEPHTYEKRAYDFYQETIAKIYRLYQSKLKHNNALDFDDLIMKTVELFQLFPDILDQYQERFQYIMVDEYQDTNHAQYRLINMLAAKYRNLCVVGDDDQSVYHFRGADIQNILDFERDYPEAKVVRLEQNYRSTKSILEVANEIIRNNSGRKEKRLWTENPSGYPISLYTAQDEHQEAYYVAKNVIYEHDRKERPYTDFAVLYRTNAQSRVIEDIFMRNNIPYTIVGGLKFYERKEIKDVMAYLKVISNPADSISLQRIINVPRRGIGDASIAKAAEYARDHQVTLFRAFGMAEEISTLAARIAKPMSQFTRFIEEMQELKYNSSVTELAREVLTRSGYLQELEAEHTIEAETRIENLNEFLAVTDEFDKGINGSLEEFLAGVSLVADIDNLDEKTEAVVLMTLHSAKGLEFPVVYMIGMEEGVFPHSRSMLENTELEEERRLCYVGVTRAREELHMLHAAQRNLYGNYMHNMPSRFLKEIPDHLLRHTGIEGPRSYSETGGSKTGFSSFGSSGGSSSLNNGISSSGSIGGLGATTPSRAATGNAPKISGEDFVLGEKVEHGKWGQGVIVSVKGEGLDAEVSIAFPGVGIKKLIARYAPIKKI